jgi:outer membrane protein insertion porin family
MIINKSTITNQFGDLFSGRCLRGLGLTAFLLAAVTNTLAGQDPEAIKQIEVVGAQKITKENLLFRIGIREGDDFRSIDFSSIVERMWAIGAYDDVKIKFRDEEDGKVLIIEVVERPIVKEVDYRGGTQIGHSNIRDKIKEDRLEITPDTIYDPDAARKIKTKIVDLAAEKGFNDPIVDIILEPMGAGICRIVFDIKEGGKARIQRINLLGNKVFSDRRITGRMGIMKKTREYWMFSWLTSSGLLVDKNIEEDTQKLKDAYLRRGYKDIFVGQPIREIHDFTKPRQQARNIKRIEQFKSPKYDLRATLTFQILEGDRYYEGTLGFEGNNSVPGMRGERGEEADRKSVV